MSTYYAQLKVLDKTGGTPLKMPCVCGGRFNLARMYKCLYCNVWHCMECAEVHFGKTRKEYLKEKGRA